MEEINLNVNDKENREWGGDDIWKRILFNRKDNGNAIIIAVGMAISAVEKKSFVVVS